MRRAWGPGTGRWVCTAAREPGVAAVVLETTGEGPRSERKAASVVRPGVLPWPRGRDVSSTGATVVSVAVEQGSQSCTAPQWFPSRRGLRASGLSLQVGPGSPVLAGPAQAYRWGPAGLGQPSLGSLGPLGPLGPLGSQLRLLLQGHRTWTLLSESVCTLPERGSAGPAARPAGSAVPAGPGADQGSRPPPLPSSLCAGLTSRPEHRFLKAPPG